MKRSERKIMTLTMASHGLVHFYEGVLPPLIPLVMAEFGGDYFRLGMIVSLFSYAFGLGSLPAGMLSDRLGPRPMVTTYLFGAGVAGVCVFAAGSFWFYGLIMLVMGAFCSVYHPTANALISRSVQRKGNAFGLHGIAGSLGVAIAPLLSAWIGIRLGWRAPHVVFGLLGIGIGIYALTSAKSKPAEAAPETEPRPDATPAPRTPMTDLILFFLAATALGLVYKGTMTFLPTYLGQNFNVSFLPLDPVSVGGTVATVALLSGVLGQYLAGRLTDRFPAEQIYLVATIGGTLFVGLMVFASDLLLLVATIGFSLFYFAVQPVQNLLVSNYLPVHRHGFGFGLLFILSFGVGSTAAAVCGYLADRFGLRAVFVAMAVCFFASVILVAGLVIRGKKSDRSTTAPSPETQSSGG